MIVTRIYSIIVYYTMYDILSINADVSLPNPATHQFFGGSSPLDLAYSGTN